MFQIDYMNFYNIISYFIIYAFFGWSLEVVYQAVEQGKFINRGFLNGPYCPIYGFGVIIVVGILEPIKNNLIVLYLGSVILTSLLELFTGFILEKIFNMKWWDYSQEKFNLHGYICLKFSLLWGVACLIVVRLIHPLITVFVSHIPRTLGIIIISVIMLGFVSDMIFTVLAIINFKKKIHVLEGISAEMRKISDKTGEKIFDTVEEIKTRKDALDEKRNEMRKRTEELREKYKNQLEKRSFNIRRIEKSFPRLKSNNEKTLKQYFLDFKEEISERHENKNDTKSS